MGIFERFFGKQEQRAAIPVSDPQIARIFGGYTSHDRAAKLSTSSRCISVIASAYSAADQTLFKQTKDGPVEAENHPLYGLLLNGTAALSAYELKYRLMESLLTHGEAFAEIVFDDAGKPLDIIPHAWRNVAPEALGNGRIIFRVADPLRNYTQRVLTQDSMCHIKYRPIEWRGVSPLEASALSMGIITAVELAVEKDALTGFRASGMLSAPGAINDQTAQRLKTNLETNYAGIDGTGRIIVAGDGLTYSSMNNSAVENQILESRKMGQYQIAQAYGVPPEAVGLVEHSSWSSSEESNRQLVTLCLEGWAQCMNQQLAAFVLSARERKTHYIASNWQALTAGNLQTKAAAVSSMVSSQVLTRNEARRIFFDLPKIDGLDEMVNPFADVKPPFDPARNGEDQSATAGAA